MLNSFFKLNMIICTAQIADTRPCLAWYKGGLITMDLNSQIKHFKTGTVDWDINPVKIRQFLTTTSATGKEYLIGWSKTGEILELDLQKQRFLTKKDCYSNIIEFCLIYPLCNYFVSLCLDYKVLKTWDALLGKVISTITIEDKIKTVSSNPVYPYITTGLYNGTLIIISYYNCETPTILTKFRLCDKEINKIVYNEAGNLIAAAHIEEGIFFILRGTPDKIIEIISYFNYQKSAIDIALLEHKKSYKLLILVQSEIHKNCGDRIHVKMILKSNLKIKKKNYRSQRLIRRFLVLNDTFIANIFNEQNLSVFQLKKKIVKFKNEIICKNHLYCYKLKTNGCNLYTYSTNGLLTIFNHEYTDILATFIIHHRNDNGIKNVLVDSFLRFVITLGQENELIFTKVTELLFEENKYKSALNIFNKYKDCFVQFNVDPEDLTYIKKKQINNKLEEQNKYANERKEIMEEFLLVKNELITLFDQNINGPEEEKIDIFEFYLHIKLKEHKEKLCELESEWINKYYNELISAQNKLCEYLKKKFWDTQLVKRSVIKGIFSNFYVENYGLIPECSKFQSKYNYILMLREFEEMCRSEDILLPLSDLKGKISNPSLEYNIDNIEDYPSSVVPQLQEEILFYNQKEIYTCTQSFFQKLLIDQTSIQIRQLFNKTYDEVMNRKKDVMKSILEMNTRLRFILSELEINNIDIKDPEWDLAEVPEKIITVDTHELSVKPYISESCQALLDEKAAKEEKIRLILLADDFREKTLTRIMDGLLEVRWEDTLKWDVVKPECMFEKKPDKFSKEDVSAVEEYETKVEFLNHERQRYRHILQNEYTQISETVRIIIKNFNSELSKLRLFKIKVETGRLQHRLMVQLMQDTCFKLEELQENEDATREKIKVSDKRNLWINNKLTELIEASNECKIFAESLSVKDKLIEKNFKKEIQDYSALVQEHGYKLFKKQPKGNFINVNSPTLLNILGACIVSQEKSQLLTFDCIEFLKSVDKLDEYVGVPNSIGETVYKIICKYRRMRIEVEIRTKGNQLEQIDIDAGVQYFQKILIDNKEITTQLLTELNNIRIKKLELVHDKHIQIVVKRGCLEIPTSGYISDFSDALLIDRHEIEHINSVIKNIGQHKLKILKNIMIHRREIIEKEWEHKKKRMEIEDLNEFLHIVENVKVTKELRQYLLRKERNVGILFNKDLTTFDQEFESTRKTYDRILEEREKAINELQKQIEDYKKKNNLLDKKISEFKIDKCEQELMRDIEFEINHKSLIEKRMKKIIKRSALIKNIQEQHNEILVLQTELELARLKTYPTLKLKKL